MNIEVGHIFQAHICLFVIFTHDVLNVNLYGHYYPLFNYLHHQTQKDLLLFDTKRVFFCLKNIKLLNIIAIYLKLYKVHKIHTRSSTACEVQIGMIIKLLLLPYTHILLRWWCGHKIILCKWLIY